MTRVWLAFVVEAVLAIAVALVLAALGQLLLGSAPDEVAGDAATVLFLYTGAGLALWVLVSIVLLVRRRSLPGMGIALLVALLAVVVNAIVVLAVGIGMGGWGPLMILFAIEGGIAFLLAVVVAAPIARLVVRSAASSASTAPPAP